MKPIVVVAGARPNFMKVAPIVAELDRRGLPRVLVHTGQHYDDKMSDVFFADLGMPAPDVHLGVGSGSHAEQTAKVMLGFEPVVLSRRPQSVVVVGDVNSTIACALVAVKLGVPVAHVEAGLRSFDPDMPEEINRVLTDRISRWLLTPSRDADENLRAEGAAENRIVRVGNVMIDSLLAGVRSAAERSACAAFGAAAKGYALVTLHRPSNVDDPAVFAGLVGALERVAEHIPVVWPMHPRAAKNARTMGFWSRLHENPAIRIGEPQGYLDFLSLMRDAALVLTDSGGLQEETTALGVPCLTLRENTERPVTVIEGSNEVVGVAPDAIVRAALHVLTTGGKRGRIPELWDGRAAPRIVDAILGGAAPHG
jgi:UDP-N-acetylglucosamine 2-epimerase (non-hydrolysing)